MPGILYTNGSTIIGTPQELDDFDEIRHSSASPQLAVSLALSIPGAVDLPGELGTVAASVQGAETGSDITSGAGDDTIMGGSGADSFAGGLGNDLLKGGGGDDTLMGGSRDLSTSYFETEHSGRRGSALGPVERIFLR